MQKISDFTVSTYAKLENIMAELISLDFEIYSTDKGRFFWVLPNSDDVIDEPVFDSKEQAYQSAIDYARKFTKNRSDEMHTQYAAMKYRGYA